MNFFTYCIKKNTQNMLDSEGRVSAAYYAISWRVEFLFGVLPTIIALLLGQFYLVIPNKIIVVLLGIVFLLPFAFRLFFVMLSLSIRRLHDLGYSGTWLILSCLLFFSMIVAIVHIVLSISTVKEMGHQAVLVVLLNLLNLLNLMTFYFFNLKEGTNTKNAYGPVPLGHFKIKNTSTLIKATDC